MHRRKTAEEGTFRRKIRPIKPIIKTGRSGLESSNSSSSALVISSESEDEEDGWKKKERMELMPNDYTVQVCFLKNTTMKIGFDAKNA